MWQRLVGKWRKLSREGKALVIVVAVVVVAILVFCLVPIMRVPYQVEESYLATETYYEMEKYTVEEEYPVTESYTAIEVFCDEEPCTEYIPIDFVVISGEGYNYIEFDGSPSSYVALTIRNTDIIDGEFTVDFLVTLHDNSIHLVSASNYITAGGTETVIAYNYGTVLQTLTSFSYSVSAPQKPDPSYREEEVTKEREVMVYGEVTKERYIPVELTVLKTEMVTHYKRVSVLSYLINY